jgi:hypothetical protein
VVDVVCGPEPETAADIAYGLAAATIAEDQREAARLLRPAACRLDGFV